jgi:thiamine biosynthesis protein ThiI
MKYIVKFFPEIMIKGDAIKKRMVRRLHENVLRLLKRLDDQIVTTKYWDKIEVFVPDLQPGLVSEAEKVLLNTPGIDQVWRIQQFPITDVNSVVEQVVPFALPLIAGKTFAVRARRAGQHPFTSLDLEREVGRVLIEQGDGLKVDLKNPQVKIEFDIYDNYLNIIEARLPAMGGYPIGSQGEALSLMSGGFDSTVASYLSIKRGVKTHFIFFNLGGTAHELGVKQVAIYLWNRFEASHRVHFISVPFENVVAELFRSVHESYMGVVLKRLMLQAAEQIADQLDIQALITGESVAQVSSQTLKNLAVIDEASSKLILRPLAFMHKTDIMAIADNIGTRQFAETMPEYCGVISKNPVIEASFHRTLKEAARFDQDVLNQAVAQMTIVPVDELVAQIVAAAPVPVMSGLTEQDVLVDIRATSEQQAKPLDNSLSIPFYQLSQAAKKWSADKRYLLYCKKGVLSQLHAQYLRDAGYHNVYVYRNIKDSKA